MSLPSTIGRYQVVGRLAMGGMAEILLGKLVGPSGFERPVVIKRILPHLATQSSFVAMFLDEARIGGEIRHPNVVQTYELGRDGDELFLVMEYLEGESAAGLMRRLLSLGERLDHALAAHIVAESCAGLHAAHELKDENGNRRNLVHRDVSPQNLFISYSGQIKVLDFGIAKAMGRAAHTTTGQLKGKFAYMSPEQCTGASLDPRSDVFSLGVVLYELTTGQRLFKRPTELMVLKAVCEEPIPRPSKAVEGYPSSLEAICLRALARTREDRYPTAAEMRRDLLAALRDLDGGAVPEEGLSLTMRRLFAERIAEKEQMLRRVRAGSSVTRLPPAEFDEYGDLPPGEGSPRGLALAPTPSAVPELRSTRHTWVWALAAAVTLAAGATLAMLLGSPPAESRAQPDAGPLAAMALDGPATRPTPPPKPAAPAVPDAGSPVVVASRPAPPSRTVTIHVETTPPGASVKVRGRKLGRTPCDLSFPRGQRPIQLELRRASYALLVETVVPDIDQRLHLSLPRERRAVRRPPPRPPKPPPPAEEKGFHRFE